MPDPPLDTGKAIPIGFGKSLARTAHGGAHVRRDIPEPLIVHRFKLRAEVSGSRACGPRYRITKAGNPRYGLTRA